LNPRAGGFDGRSGASQSRQGGTSFMQRRTVHNLSQAEEVLRSKAFYVGTVKTANEGFAIVDCPDSGYEAGIYVHKASADLSQLQEGDLLAFEIHISKQGKPQVSAPVWKHAGFTKKDGSLEFGEFLGQVAEVNAQGYGKMECSSVVEQHSQMANVHSKIVEQCGLVLHDVIAFSVHVGDSGVPWVQAPCWKSISDAKFIESWRHTEAPTEEAPPAEEGEELPAENAEEEGAEDQGISAADEEQEAPASDPREELQSMTKGALIKKAVSIGVDDAALEAATEGTKDDVIELILAMQESSSEPAAKRARIE